MFKFRTLTICLKSRVVVIVSWVVSCRVSSHHLSSSSLRRDSGSFQFFLQHYSPFSRQIRNTVLTWNEKKNSQGIYTKNKSCTWPLSSLYNDKKKKCSITATRSPPNLYSKTLTL